MSRRRPQRRRSAHASPPVSLETIVEWRGEPWVVRPIRGSSSGKPYRCPGCDQLIPPATPHTVVWPEVPIAAVGIDERRHWHTPCWDARDRRSRR